MAILKKSCTPSGRSPTILSWLLPEPSYSCLLAPLSKHAPRASPLPPLRTSGSRSGVWLPWPPRQRQVDTEWVAFWTQRGKHLQYVPSTLRPPPTQRPDCPPAGSTVKGKSAARSPSSASNTSTSTASSNAFATLADLDEPNTMEEQLTLDLLGLPDDSFSGSVGGDLSFSKHVTPPTDPIALIARRLARPRPTTPPGTTSGAGSSSISDAPELGCAQNADGSLKEAEDIVFFNDPDDDTPLPAPTTSSSAEASAVTHANTTAAPLAPSPFLAPVTSSPAVTTPQGTDLAGAATAIDRARQAVAAAMSLPVFPLTAPPPAPCAAPPPAYTAAPVSVPAAALLPVPAPTPTPLAVSPAAPLPLPHLPTPEAAPGLALPAPSAGTQPAAGPSFSMMVTRSQARRTAAGAPMPNTLPFGMFIPLHAPAASATASTANLSTPPPGQFPPLPQAAPVANAAQPPAGPGAQQPAQVAPAAPPPAQLLPGAQPAAPAPGVGTAGTAAIPGVGTVGAATTLVVPAAAAAVLTATPLPLFCHVPADTPGLYRPDRITAFDNVCPAHLSKWDALSGVKILVYEWSGRPHSRDSTAVEDLKTSIGRIIGSAPLVGPPVAENPSSRSAPFMYLLLLTNHVWNIVGRHTFFTIPYDAPSSNFLFTLDGFSFTADDGVEVANLVVEVIHGNHMAQTLLSLNHDAYPSTADADPMAHFTASVRVSPTHLKGAGGRTCIAWNVTAAPPSSDVANNHAWVSALSPLIFASTMHWEARAVSPPLSCAGCKSPGHSIGLCPLHVLPVISREICKTSDFTNA
ncbi:hypothetical protein DFH07DRAFT_965056 [Mycena maculata]|uniref:Uncharacterized protein n=1 Tax=Mycena maculata TaxID=230809 RepID=A0AAD7IEB3_9AGAR|nr:hypothetical protein DFH07DRAFT_965056 [Mycena maculata]